MKKLLLIFLLSSIFVSSFAQISNPSVYRWINGTFVPNSVSAPATGEGAFWFQSGRLTVHNGSLWQAYLSMTEAATLYYPLASNPSSYLTPTTGVTSITGTTSQITASASVGGVVLSLPQNIATTSSPVFRQVSVSAAAGTTRDYDWSTAGISRWKLRASSTTESGSNTGTPLQLLARDDSGNALFTVWSATRSTGEFNVPNFSTTQLKLTALNTAPASATATGTLGEIRITATAIYICTATNVWVKANLATF